MRLLLTSILIATSLTLIGCVHLTGNIVCLTGVCPSDKERLAAIQWTPAKLDKTGCQIIDGEYKELGWFGNNKESKESLIKQFDFRLHRDDKRTREVNMQADYEIYQKIPSIPVERTVIHTPIERVGGRYMKMPPEEKKVIVNDDSVFYKNAVTSIKQQGQTLDVTLMDENGTRYEKSILALNDQQTGCYEGKLVIRRMNIDSGITESSSYGSAYAVELRFKKLPNGNLQITKQAREWFYTGTRGFIGYDTNHHPSGTEPRKSESILVFPVAKAP